MNQQSAELPQSVSVVMRNKNEGPVVAETLAMLGKQDFQGKVELIVIDSGSTDCSLQILKDYQPDYLHEIKPHEYIPGVILNWGMRRASHDWVVFLNSDATPLNEQWLTNLLIASVTSKNFGAAFSQQVVRKGAKAVFAIDYDKCFGPHRISDQWDHFFSMVSSIAYKPSWGKHPFDEAFQYSEDDEWSRRLKRAGYEIVYVAESKVIHSHNYTFKQTIKRAYGEMVARVQDKLVPANSISLLKDVFISSLGAWIKDIPYHLRNGKALEIPSTYFIRFAQRYGAWKGSRK
ncbi:MAG: glycosyltransferase [Lentisphaeraceae bacterium]|nr:glycosyltransferase [Lentisphaeraceae bacterium]